MSPLDRVAPAFVEMAHQIVWATAATVDRASRPWTRILHPVWAWDGHDLTGVVATMPDSPKRAHLDAHPFISFTYWHPSHDNCTAQCDAVWDDTPQGRASAWDAFATGPEPVGYDPAIIEGWDDPTSPAFGVLRLRPWRLQVFPGSRLTEGTGEILTWSGRG